MTKLMPRAPCRWFHIKIGCTKPDDESCPLSESLKAIALNSIKESKDGQD